MSDEQLFARGFVAVPRRALELLQGDPTASLVFLAVLRRARIVAGAVRTARGSTIALGVGQCVVGRDELAREIGAPANGTRAAIKRLERHQLITSEGTTKGTIISLVEPERYVGSSPASHQRANQQTTSKPPASHQQTTSEPPLTDQGPRDLGPRDHTQRARASGDDGYIPEPSAPEQGARQRAQKAYDYLVRRIAELDGVAGVPRLGLVPGGQYLRDSGLVTAARDYTDEQLRHVVDVRIAEARRTGSGRWLNPAAMFKGPAIAFALALSPDDAGADSSTTTGGGQVVAFRPRPKLNL